MALESDEQIAARKQRERDVKAAWRAWKSKVPLARKLAATLPPATPSPKAIVTTGNRRIDTGDSRNRWKSWGPDRRAT